MTGHFIALEGPDGVGKTTLAARVASTTYSHAVDRLGIRAFGDSSRGNGPDREGRRGNGLTVLPTACGSAGVDSGADSEHDTGGPTDDGAGAVPLVFVSRRQISATSVYSAKLMEHLATVLWHSGDAPDLPDAFWVGMQAAWFTAHGTTVVRPLLEADYDVIVDGWLFKFWSKLLLQGYALTDLEIIFGRVLMPDAVILLRSDVAALYDRRAAQFRPAELGMHAGYGQLGRATFVDYQQAGLDQLTTFAAQYRWPVVELDPADTPQEAGPRIASIVRRLRTETTAVPRPPHP